MNDCIHNIPLQSTKDNHKGKPISGCHSNGYDILKRVRGETN